MQHCSTPLYTFLKLCHSMSVLPTRTNWHVSWQHFTVQDWQPSRTPQQVFNAKRQCRSVNLQNASITKWKFHIYSSVLRIWNIHTKGPIHCVWRVWSGADHSRTRMGEVKNAWSHTFTLPYAFRARGLMHFTIMCCLCSSLCPVLQDFSCLYFSHGVHSSL